MSLENSFKVSKVLIDVCQPRPFLKVAAAHFPFCSALFWFLFWPRMFSLAKGRENQGKSGDT